MYLVYTYLVGSICTTTTYLERHTRPPQQAGVYVTYTSDTAYDIFFRPAL